MIQVTWLRPITPQRFDWVFLFRGLPLLPRCNLEASMVLVSTAVLNHGCTPAVGFPLAVAQSPRPFPSLTGKELASRSMWLIFVSILLPCGIAHEMIWSRLEPTLSARRKIQQPASARTDRSCRSADAGPTVLPRLTGCEGPPLPVSQGRRHVLSLFPPALLLVSQCKLLRLEMGILCKTFSLRLGGRQAVQPSQASRKAPESPHILSSLDSYL
ncbi:hypothetical protein LY78DRAFT_671 [Colletotrichum sublineola]|nr:hypothetical protein LY78DRAFT_671 [Colletotrichum sublineola]